MAFSPSEIADKPQGDRKDTFYDLPLTAGFTILLLVAFLWPRYFYLQVGGFGVSLFIVSTFFFVSFIVPIGLMYPRVAANFIGQISRSGYVWFAFIMTFSWRLLTSAIAQPINGELPFATFLRSHLAIAAYFLIGSVFFLDKRMRRRFPFFIIVIVFPIALLGLVEYLTETKILILTGLSRFAISNANLNGILLETFRSGHYRVQSLFSQPLVFGQFMAAMLPVCLAVAGVTRGGWRFAAWSAVFLCLESIWISTSRSAIFVAVVAGVSYAVLRFASRSRNKRVTLLVCTFVLLYVGGTASLVSDSTSLITGQTLEEQISSEARGAMLERTFEQASRSPVFGAGDGSSKWLAGIIGKDGDVATIDSLYLSIILCNGYLGLIFTVTLFIAIIIMGTQNALNASTVESRIINAGLTALVVGLSVGFSVLTIEDNLVFVYLSAAYMMADRIFYVRRLPMRVDVGEIN